MVVAAFRNREVGKNETCQNCATPSPIRTRGFRQRESYSTCNSFIGDMQITAARSKISELSCDRQCSLVSLDLTTTTEGQPEEAITGVEILHTRVGCFAERQKQIIPLTNRMKIQLQF